MVRTTNTRWVRLWRAEKLESRLACQRDDPCRVTLDSTYSER